MNQFPDGSTILLINPQMTAQYYINPQMTAQYILQINPQMTAQFYWPGVIWNWASGRKVWTVKRTRPSYRWSSITKMRLATTRIGTRPGMHSHMLITRPWSSWRRRKPPVIQRHLVTLQKPMIPIWWVLEKSEKLKFHKIELSTIWRIILSLSVSK